jgi:carboxyl-terminal processing protease
MPTRFSLTHWTIATLIVLVLCTGDSVASISRPAGPDPARPGSELAQEMDFASMSWVEAFKGFHDQISTLYPFTRWKNINWDQRSARFGRRIAEAQAKRDVKAYYLALREYVCAIPDGHVRLRGEAPAQLMYSNIGGGYGISIVESGDRRALISLVIPGSPAAVSGIKPGAEVTYWNGQHIADAVDRTSLLWADRIPATEEGERLQKYRLLTRSPVGTTTKVVFRNPGDRRFRTVSLTSADDKFDSFNQSSYYVTADERKSPLTYKLLDNGYGYIKITLIPSPEFGDISQTLKEAILEFTQARTKGIVIDLRHNGGGDDSVTAKLPGFFYPEREQQFSVEYFQPASKRFEIDPKEIYWTEPLSPLYSGPVVVMVSPGTVSGGEGLAMALRRRPNVKVVSFYGSNGSFGSTGGVAKMPGGYSIFFPIGRAVDKDGKILLDSDSTGRGGVSPDIRVPRTLDGLRDAILNGIDLELAAATDYLDRVSREE